MKQVNLAIETDTNSVAAPSNVNTTTKEKKYLPLQEIISRGKAYLIEVYGDDAVSITVEETFINHSYHGSHIQLSFQLATRTTDNPAELKYERKEKTLVINPRTGIVESMTNADKKHR